MKASSIWLIVLTAVLGLCGCRNDSARSVSVECAPRILKRDEWAVLCITQHFKDGEPLVELDLSKIERAASAAPLIDSTHIRGNGRFRVQIVKIRPLSTNVTLTTQYFRNGVNLSLGPPITISFEE